jgi:hypothetical protein
VVSHLAPSESAGLEQLLFELTTGGRDGAATGSSSDPDSDPDIVGATR